MPGTSKQVAFFCSVTDIRPYGSTHPAPPLPRVLDAVNPPFLASIAHETQIGGLD